jgi:hypothetical protein
LLNKILELQRLLTKHFAPQPKLIEARDMTSRPPLRVCPRRLGGRSQRRQEATDKGKHAPVELLALATAKQGTKQQWSMPGKIKCLRASSYTEIMT